MPDVLQERRVRHRIDHCIVLSGIDVPAPEKIRRHEDVVSRPVEALAADLRDAAAFDHDVERAGGFALELGLLSWTQKLGRVVERREYRLAGHRVDEIDLDALVRISLFLAQAVQRFLHVGAAVMNKRGWAAADTELMID